MSRHAHVTLLAVTCVSLAVAAPETVFAQKVQGKIKDKVYTAPASNFSVPVPTTGLGVKVSDAYDKKEGVGAVSFHDDFGSQRGVLYVRIPQEYAARAADRATRRGLLEGALQGAAMPEWFLRASPEAKVLIQEPLTLDNENDDAFVGLVSLPGGSPLQDQRSGKRLDSTRAVLTVYRNGFIYFLMIEVGDGVFQLTRKPPEGMSFEPSAMLERGRTRLMEFHKTIAYR